MFLLQIRGKAPEADIVVVGFPDNVLAGYKTQTARQFFTGNLTAALGDLRDSGFGRLHYLAFPPSVKTVRACRVVLRVCLHEADACWPWQRLESRLVGLTRSFLGCLIGLGQEKRRSRERCNALRPLQELNHRSRRARDGGRDVPLFFWISMAFSPCWQCSALGTPHGEISPALPRSPRCRVRIWGFRGFGTWGVFRELGPDRSVRGSCSPLLAISCSRVHGVVKSDPQSRPSNSQTPVHP